MDTAPEFYGQTGCYYGGGGAATFTTEKRLSDAKNGDHFVIEDLLNFPTDEGMLSSDEGGVLDEAAAAAAITSSAVVDTSCNSSFSAVNADQPHFQYQSADFAGSRGGHFSGELCVPYDDLAELEWLSNFVEESFSSDDLQKLHIIQGMKTRPDQLPVPDTHHQYHFQPESSQTGRILRPELSAPAKAARSKRSRAAAPGNWTSRLLAAPQANAAVPAASSSSESDVAAARSAVYSKKKEGPENSSSAGGGEGRRCVHCATDKTPQWRTGPMGPKTLCNACGVRYKSGRLVPEYRPAASPTFVLTKHSNSHRKVVELRRQKEQMRAQQQQQQQQQFLHHHHHHHHHHQSMMFDVSNGGDDYLIHQHIGPDFRQLI
ncbi:hypothetical protein ABFS82_05G132600 [Erythranthe guttata]|uniref:GATA transcription factor n=1 Tax=Erythranthe guttata TaxID=4155 RepID=A0A022QKP2_ERYGU|nr:PREDICTED: GATA transcription factor 12-like [Erythranthe guttata]EYU29287.1 hypothetical protein MIMGU_mgv1a024688mg [Erythranthe guttata]|eukprot:XP_012847086.1 PREDICTED: GATA transcription factor 12-like [Erythranthe guttata]